MGKGDKKTRRGKIHNGSYGVLRPRIKKRPTTESKINISKQPPLKTEALIFRLAPKGHQAHS